MQADLPIQAVAAIATIVAALIAAALSFVNLTLSKEQKISEFRQAWIDALREDLASFFAAARAVARTTEIAQQFGVEYNDKALLPVTQEKISELRYQGAETFYRIKLRLNPDETEHKELLRLLGRAIEEQNKMMVERTSNAETLTAIDLASDYARPVLKTEWRLVKLGERPFRTARNWLAAVIVVSLIFLVFVLTRQFKT